MYVNIVRARKEKIMDVRTLLLCKLVYECDLVEEYYMKSLYLSANCPKM